METKKVLIRDLLTGDTVLINGVLKTVCKHDVKFCSFMGYSLFGSCYPKMVNKVIKL